MNLNPNDFAISVIAKTLNVSQEVLISMIESGVDISVWLEDQTSMMEQEK